MEKLIYDVVIVGGGVIGQTLAHQLAKMGLELAVVDRNAFTLPAIGNHFDAKVYALNQRSQQILQDAGSGTRLTRYAPYHEMMVWDQRGGGKIHFSCQEVAQPSLGCIVEDQVLRHAVLTHSQAQPQIDLYPQQQLTQLHIEPQHACLTSPTHQWKARLIIGADGGQSWIRQQAAIAVKQWSYAQQAIVAVVQTKASHQNIARQCFTPTGPLAWLPLPDEHQCVIVFSTSEDQRYAQMNEALFADYLTQLAATTLGETQLVSQRMMFPLTMRHAKYYTQHRLALVGDAVRTIHPLAGQGMNYGLQDVAELVELIRQHHQARRDYGAWHNLRAYERARKAASWQVIAAMESFKQLFTHSSRPLAVLRSAGLNFVDQWPWLKRYFIAQALGIGN
ncbi:MAG: hypothetical protein GKR77_03520 [Legionellales bacterium]|nr:hypothetical protein [Legionellales bacterium]